MTGQVDKVVVIVGASCGIGRATALALVVLGTHLVLAARNATSLCEVAELVRTTGGTGDDGVMRCDR